MAHRVVILLTLWLALWMVLGAFVGQFLFYTFWTGVVNGFVFAVVTTLLWPWILPPAVDRWMDDVKT
jgi:hypothetical protein